MGSDSKVAVILKSILTTMVAIAMATPMEYWASTNESCETHCQEPNPSF